jgi:outer membrane protein OmpA-like peptidoglycan-associated protein
VTFAVIEEHEWGDETAGVDSHVGPWPAFVDLFAATSLVFLVFFIVVSYRYVGEAGSGVKVRQLYDVLSQLEKKNHQFVVQQQGADVLLILEERVTFRTGEAILLPEARGVLSKLVEILQGREFAGLIREIEILGHADRRGNAFSNWQLSAERAVSVAQFLVESKRISPCIVTASGRGAYFPRDSATRPDTLSLAARSAAYASDRRVEILLRPTVTREKSAGRSGCRG